MSKVTDLLKAWTGGSLRGGEGTDEALALAQSLESGDAYGAGNPTDVLLRSDPTPEWGPVGGGTDLSAVNEDIVLLNDHVIQFRMASGDPVADRHSIGWSDSVAPLAITGTPAQNSSSVALIHPIDPDRYVVVAAYDYASLILFANGAGESAQIRLAGDSLFWVPDMLHNPGRGPILRAPNASLHRLIVANDGSLSTEAVV